MMFWVQLCVVVVLLIAVGWVAVGGGGHMSGPVPDRPDPAVPDTGLLARGDVDKVRFSVGARGYRMDEVDDILDRLAYEIDVRDRHIAELEGQGAAPFRPSTAPGPDGVRTEFSARPGGPGAADGGAPGSGGGSGTEGGIGGIEGGVEGRIEGGGTRAETAGEGGPEGA